MKIESPSALVKRYFCYKTTYIPKEAGFYVKIYISWKSVVISSLYMSTFSGNITLRRYVNVTSSILSSLPFYSQHQSHPIESNIQLTGRHQFRVLVFTFLRSKNKNICSLHETFLYFYFTKSKTESLHYSLALKIVKECFTAASTF